MNPMISKACYLRCKFLSMHVNVGSQSLLLSPFAADTCVPAKRPRLDSNEDCEFTIECLYVYSICACTISVFLHIMVLGPMVL